MTSLELDGYRQRLLNLGSRLRDDHADLAGEALRTAGGEASGNLSNAPLHPADLGTDHFEQEMSLSLLENERQLMGEIGAALDRIERGTYGPCERCHREISKERLEALPYTRFCVDCARRTEHEAEGPSPVRL
jgi:RNA polymerase-binding protein DksA